MARGSAGLKNLIHRWTETVERVYLLFDRPGWRVAAVSLSAALALTGAFLFALGSIIYANLLNTSFYSRAFDQNRAYDRVYEDVLADPALAVEINRALRISDPERSIAISTLRVLLPPDRLRGWTEDGVEALVEYLDGRRSTMAPGIDLLSLPLNRPQASSVQVESGVSTAQGEPARTDVELISTILTVRDLLAAGQVPDTVPVGETNERTAALAAAAILAPLNGAARQAIEEQVIAHLTADDIRGALAIAAPYLARLAGSSPDGQSEDDALQRASARINDWLQQGIDGIGPLRTLTNGLGPWALPLSIISLSLAWLLAGAAAHGDAVRRTSTASIILIAAAVIVGVFFITLGPTVIDRQVDSATGGSVVSSAPESVRVLVGDVQKTLVSNMSNTAAESMIWIGTAGLISTLIPLALLLGQRRGRIDIRHPMFVPVGGWALLLLAMTVGPFALESSVQAQAVLCNGRSELCSKRYNEVTYPGTHNAMSSSADGWMFPYQDATMRRQLEEGIRVFLIDVHYWGTADEYLQEVESIENLPAQARTYLASLQGRLTTAPEGVFLCHASCWLGARPIDVALREIKAFMEANPREVVTLILQDHVPSEEIVDAFRRTGLNELAHSQPAEEEWPTLGEMIDSERRLVVFSENSGEPPAWFHNAWTYMWDTRFDFMSLSELDCEPNRGDRENNLLLANHWIRSAVPDRADATRMNSVPRILDRVDECVEEFEKTPNFIAVDFYRVGNLLRAVDEINGIGAQR